MIVVVATNRRNPEIAERLLPPNPVMRWIGVDGDYRLYRCADDDKPVARSLADIDGEVIAEVSTFLNVDAAGRWIRKRERQNARHLRLVLDRRQPEVVS